VVAIIAPSLCAGRVIDAPSLLQVRTGQPAGSVPGLGGEAPSYLLPAEVAELLSVSPKTVSRWAKEGKLPFMSTLGGHRRYPEAEIRQLVDELRQEPTA
jgi:excisionase family DNA binding protein